MFPNHVKKLLRYYIFTHKYHIVLANMLFCHQIHCIFRINALLSQNFVVLIYAFFPPIFSLLKSRTPPICSLLGCMTVCRIYCVYQIGKCPCISNCIVSFDRRGGGGARPHCWPAPAWLMLESCICLFIFTLCNLILLSKSGFFFFLQITI